MSRNLCTDKCDCGYVFTLDDFRDRKVEFRKYGEYAPIMGVKLQCPKCHKFYFGWIRHHDTYWGESKEVFDQPFITLPNGHSYANKNCGKFARRVKDFRGRERVEELGAYEIDISYYESYNDEGCGMNVLNPAHLFTKTHDRKTHIKH